MSRHDLSDAQWELIARLLPPQPKVGRKRRHDRRTVNGILDVLKTGCAWVDWPKEYGSASTCWRWFERWSADGTWEGISRTLLSALDAQAKVEWAQAFLDGSFVPAKKGGWGRTSPRGSGEPGDAGDRWEWAAIERVCRQRATERASSRGGHPGSVAGSAAPGSPTHSPQGTGGRPEL